MTSTADIALFSGMTPTVVGPPLTQDSPKLKIDIVVTLTTKKV